jgi:DNA-binding response OmpR family regulator
MWSYAMRVLVVDGDQAQLDSLTVGLRFGWPGCTILTAQDGPEGLRLFVEHSPTLVLIEATVPHMHGFDLLREIRRMSEVPVVILSALQTEFSHVRALDLGADDYIVRPVGMLTLLARIRAVLRRTNNQAHTSTMRQEPISVGDLRIDPEMHQVWVGDEQILLTPAEFRLLSLLARNPNRLIVNRVLCEGVWGADWQATRNDLKALVHRVRSKLGDNWRKPRYIENRRGIGYRFIAPTSGSYPD